jgi:hypothetical protein
MEKLKLTSSQLPSYTMTLPISGIVAKYRPFLVKEEKVLLIAAQSGDMNQIVDAMRNIISACTTDCLLYLPNKNWNTNQSTRSQS